MLDGKHRHVLSLLRYHVEITEQFWSCHFSTIQMFVLYGIEQKSETISKNRTGLVDGLPLDTSIWIGNDRCSM